MRERTTWNKKEVLKKASQKRAEVNNDVYTLNQERTQPAFDKYEIGGPEDFMEGVDDSNRWESDKTRDEIGRGEFIKDVPKGLEKGASHEFLLKKADLCVEVARMMLANTRVASETAIEDQAVALMHLPDLDLISTHSRLAAQEGDEDQEEGQDKQAQDQDDDQEDQDDDDQDQDKQAGEVPPQFKENVEKMKAKAEDKDEDKKDDSKKEASQQMYGQMEQMMAQMQQMMAQMQQGQQGLDQDQIQDMVQDKVQDQVGDVLQDTGLDDILDQGQQYQDLGEQDIQMDPFEMDLDDSQGLGQDDDLLRQVFAGDDDQAEDKEEDKSQQQAKQASTRTASTRTIGTKPKGVSKLGGVSKQASASQGPDLSALWTSLPDVSDAFGMKK